VKAFQHQETQLSLSQEHATKTEVAYNLLDGMNLFAAFFQLCKAGQKKMGSRLVEWQRRLKSLLWVPTGKG